MFIKFKITVRGEFVMSKNLIKKAVPMKLNASMTETRVTEISPLNVWTDIVDLSVNYQTEPI